MANSKLSAEKIAKLISQIDTNLKVLESSGLKFEDILKIIKLRSEHEPNIPLSIFSSDIGPLESLVKYLKENLALSYKEIAALLNRNPVPVGVSYRNARSKHPEKLDSSSNIKIPVSLFSKRKFSIFESLTYYLKDSLGMSFHDIAAALGRDDRTIWTVYNRFKVKNEA